MAAVRLTGSLSSLGSMLWPVWRRSSLRTWSMTVSLRMTAPRDFAEVGALTRHSSSMALRLSASLDR